MASPGVILKPIVMPPQYHPTSRRKETSNHGKRGHRTKSTRKADSGPKTFASASPESVIASQSNPAFGPPSSMLNGGKQLCGFMDCKAIPDTNFIVTSIAVDFMATCRSPPVNGLISLTRPRDACKVASSWTLCSPTEPCSKDSTKSRTFLKQVHFAEHPSLVRILEFEDDIESQDMRECYWEIFARDRARFKDRIQQSEEVLNPILDSKHREKIQLRSIKNANNGA